MWSKVLGAIALTGALAIGTSIWAGMAGVKVTAPKPNNNLPTFASVDARPASDSSEPWAKSERTAQKVREIARREALHGLTEKRGKACDTDPNERIASGLNYYLEHRAKQARLYAKSWGSEGAKFISDAWATPDDRKVEELMREAYLTGDFRLDELRSNRPLAERFIGKAKPAKIRC